MSEVLVIGHKNPDTDSICAAIGYAEFKQRTGMPNAVAARCGDTNDRIDFVLRTFGFPAPRFVANVAPKVRDVMQDNVVSLPPTATVAEALGLMDERNIRVLPVLNEDRSCRGLLSLFKMSKFFFPAPHRLFDSRTVHASLRNLARTLSAEMVFVQDPDRVESLILMIGAMSLEAFAKRLPLYPREKLIVIVGDREDVQDLAIDRGVRAIVITGGSKVSNEHFDAARRNGVSMLISPHDSATTAMLSRTSITVENMIHDKFLTFQAEEYLAEVRGLATASVFQAFPVLDEHQRVVGILSKSDLLRKVDRQLILVDHNELSQAVNGAETADIIEVIDHHRVGLMSRTPILFRNEPVGSTSTIVAEMFLRYRLEMSANLAGILLAGIVSDTLNLTSPTTTERDADILETLESISGVNATAFTEKLFASGSILVTKTAQQAVATDCKEYSENGRIFSVAQIEEMGFNQFWKRKNEVIKALAEHRKVNEYFFSALLITDVVTQSSLLLLAGTDPFLAKIEYPEIESDIYDLRGIVSRKKQLLPYLTHCLEQCARS